MYVMAAGAIVFLISTFLGWVDVGDTTFSGYETDTTIPFTAYLGVGLAAALFYAAKRATRRQHRGLSLASMAAGIAAFGLALSYMVNTPGYLERGDGGGNQIGIYVALVGALVWVVGSYLLAKEPEGDVERDNRRFDARRADADGRRSGGSS
jgi:hypothetical protein